MEKFVDVILPLPLHACFTYALPLEMAERVRIGCRVVVPFGKKKYYTGIVRNVHYLKPQAYEVKEVSAMLDERSILLPLQFRFWEWLADYYLCTQGDVYKAALPSGLKLESETVVEINPDFEADGSLTERERTILDLLAVEPVQAVTKLEKDSGLKNILGVITDVNFPSEEGREGSGLRLSKRIKEDNPEVRVLVQSTEIENREDAEKLGAGFLWKLSPSLLQDLENHFVSEYGFGPFIFRDPETGKEIAGR